METKGEKYRKWKLIYRESTNLPARAKAEGLTPAEKEEQQKLRREYIAAVKMNLRTQLDNIDMQEKDGTIRKSGERYGSKKETLEKKFCPKKSSHTGRNSGKEPYDL